MITNTPIKQIFDIYNLEMEAEDIKEALELSMDDEKGNQALHNQVLNLKRQVGDFAENSNIVYSYNTDTKTLILSGSNTPSVDGGSENITDDIIYF